jgi:hypothetical protein
MPKISELTTTSDLSGDELVPIVKAGTTKRTTIDAIREFTQFADYTAFRAYTGTARSAYVTGFDTSATTSPSGIAGPFTRDDSDTTSADNGGTILVDTSSRRWKRVFGGPVNVKWFGAVGDGVTNDVAEINSAITEVNSTGGGEVYLPAGTYLVGTIGGSTAVSLASNVMLSGAGRGSTIIKLAAGADSHVVVATSVENVGIKSLTVDGSRATQTLAVHGIRIASVDGCSVDDVEIKECSHYGFGGQDGTLSRIKLGRLDIHDTGGDGIDLKNRNDDNEDIQLTKISIRRWGLNSAQTIQAAIDIRGPARLTSIVVSEPGADDCYAVRFRQGELLDANGLGGHRSSLTGFDIRMGSAASSIALGLIARDVTVGNGYINGGHRGVLLQAPRPHLFQVTVEGVADDAFILDKHATEALLVADDARLVSCFAKDNGDRGFTVKAGVSNAQLIACDSHDNDEGVVVEATVTNFKMLGGSVDGNTTASVADSGTSSVIRDVTGFVTESRGSATILNGNTSVTVTHGLSATPTASDIVITQQTSDGGASQFWIGNIGATTFDILTDANPGKDVPMTWWAGVK